MSFQIMRKTGITIACALLSFLAVAGAGDLYRPIPENAQVTRLTRFNLRYSLRDIVADGVQKVEFYITDDMGATWRLYGEDPDRLSPMTVEVPGEGVYGFVSVATDRFGNRERAPGPRTSPETVIVVDRTPPTAKWLAPTQDFLGRGAPVELKWESADLFLGANPVRIQYAMGARSNHDRDAVWATVADNLPAAGTYDWTPPPGVASNYNIRLVVEDRAGNMAVAYCPATISIDTTPPVVTSVQPLKSNELKVDVTITADDSGGSGVKHISLYTTNNSGATWTLMKGRGENGEMVPVERSSGQSFAFEAPNSGDYGLWPVVFDQALNASPLPSVGVLGPYVLVIDNEAPTVTLSNSFLNGRSTVLSNDSRIVEWNSYDPHLTSASGALYLSLDNGNTWQQLASGLATTGFTAITFPYGSQSEEAKLRVTVNDDFGNVGESVSEVFKLTSADTVISSVSPIGGSSATEGTLSPLPVYDGSSAYDPYNAAPATDPYASVITPGGVGLALPPSDPYTSYAPDPYGASSAGTDPYAPATDPYGASSAGTDPYAPATDPYGGYPLQPYPGDPAPADIPAVPAEPARPAVNLDESTASPFPRAMIDQAGTGTSGVFPGSPASSAPSWQSSGQDFGSSSSPFLESVPQQPVGPPSAWNPTPVTTAPSSQPSQTVSSVPAPPADTSTSWTLPGTTVTSGPAAVAGDSGLPALPGFDQFGAGAASPGVAPLPPPSGADAMAATPFAPPPAPAQTSTDFPTSMPPSLDDWASGAGDLMPPPLPSGSNAGFPPPPLPQPGTSGLSMEGWGDTLAAPPLASSTPSAPASPIPSLPPADSTPSQPDPLMAGLPALPALPATSSLRPPETPSTPLAAPSTPSTPAAPPQLPSTPLIQAPPELPTIPSVGGDIAAPPLSPPGVSRPANVREQSDREARQSTAYLDEGRPDLALDAATRSLNTDDTNPLAYSALAQAYVTQEPPNYPRAATLAKEATNLGRDWYSWWTCADVFYRWAHARNTDIQTQLSSGQRPPADLVDERNLALQNAVTAVGNSAMLSQSSNDTDREKVALTQGEIVYLRALTIPEPTRPAPGDTAGAAEFRNAYAAYRSAAAPILMEALPYFQTAINLGGPPTYREAFRLGIVNFRLGGMERESGNPQQATMYYDAAAKYLEEATVSREVPPEGPREAYYMLAYCHDQLAGQPGRDRARHKELALRYWRQTAGFYPAGSSYRDYAEQRIGLLEDELGR